METEKRQQDRSDSEIPIDDDLKEEITQIYYDDVHVYVKNTPDGIHWVSGEVYRTITFATAPTGELLTWLQANGTKQ